MAAFPRRYAIYSADLNPTVGGEICKVRPVVVVSQNEMNRFLDTVVVCPLTSALHPRWRTRMQIQCADKEAEIAVDQDPRHQQAATEAPDRPAVRRGSGPAPTPYHGDVRGIAIQEPVGEPQFGPTYIQYIDILSIITLYIVSRKRLSEVFRQAPSQI